MHLCPFFLEQHFALNELVVRSGTRAAFTITIAVVGVGVGDDSGAMLALVKDEEKLIGHFLLYFYYFVIAHKVEFGGLLLFFHKCKVKKE